MISQIVLASSASRDARVRLKHEHFQPKVHISITGKRLSFVSRYLRQPYVYGSVQFCVYVCVARRRTQDTTNTSESLKIHFAYRHDSYE